MEWTEETQQRFDELRQRELAGPLGDVEQGELARLYAALEADEARYLGPTIERMGRAQQAADTELAARQTRNEELATLVQQQEQLIAEARAWLAQFERRRLLLQERYARLRRKAPPAASRS